MAGKRKGGIFGNVRGAKKLVEEQNAGFKESITLKCPACGSPQEDSTVLECSFCGEAIVERAGGEGGSDDE